MLRTLRRASQWVTHGTYLPHPREPMTDLRAAFAKTASHQPGAVDPIALFRGLRIKSGSSIKEMWAPQADALREWQSRRDLSDVVFQLNTGAGKTLIGAVAAQSLVNETRGRVVYACVTRQLAEQTRAKAEEMGIATALYLGSGTGWTDEDVYRSARGPVLTTYAAVFNGRSIFRHDDIAAAVFDDAHTAHDEVRKAFTLTIDQSTRRSLYEELTALVGDHFKAAGRGYVYETVVEGRDRASTLFVPMFEWVRHADEARRALVRAGAENDGDLLFPWAHLGARLDRCMMLFDAQRVQITPLLPPTGELRPFRAGVRRLYLSATVRVDDEFVRTFGRRPDLIITPGGRAGDTQRLFLLPPAGADDDDAWGRAEEATRGLKTVVMVPTRPAAAPWTGAGVEVFETGAGHTRVKEFAASRDQRLAFVARYDGIDLPDDACRVMVVDGLPVGLSLLDRFFESYLERAGLSDGKIASRFVQLIGRTSRGMSDYGVVLLVEHRLLDWLLAPKHRALLPEHVRRQLSIGERLSRVDGFTARDLIDLCLSQAEQWTETYDAAMEEVATETGPVPADQERAMQLALAERKAADALWDDKPENALKALLQAKQDAFAADRNLGGWMLHWAAFASQLAGDLDQADQLYRRASAVKRDLGALPPGLTAPAADVAASSPQAARMASLLDDRGAQRVQRDLSAAEADLRDGEASAAVHEEAIRTLGEYLGYLATRPDEETGGQGPDVLWATPDGTSVIFFDAKTKKVNEHYNKDLIGRSVQHALWVERQFPNAGRHHFLVGPRVPATPQSTPPAGLRVVSALELARIANATTGAYTRASSRNLPLFHPAEIEIALAQTALEWSALPESMESVRLDVLRA